MMPIKHHPLSGRIMKKILLIFTVLSLFIFFNQGLTHALCVTVSEASLRSGPGTSYKKTWEVFKYMPLKKVKTEGSWYKVKDMDGDAHWINRKLVSDKFECAAVKKDKTNVRRGPGTNYKQTLSSPLMKYDSFKVLKKQGSWVKVLDEFGEKGWIFRNLLWIY
jgi:SH3-like domain-containing protein